MEVSVFYNHEIAGAEVNDTDLVLDDEGKVHGVVNVSKIGLQYLTNQSGVWVFETLLGDSATLSGPQVFIERRVKGELVVGGTQGEIIYPKGSLPSTYGEAGLFRTANQGIIQTTPGKGTPFPLGGCYEQPSIRGTSKT